MRASRCRASGRAGEQKKKKASCARGGLCLEVEVVSWDAKELKSNPAGVRPGTKPEEAKVAGRGVQSGLRASSARPSPRKRGSHELFHGVLLGRSN